MESSPLFIVFLVVAIAVIVGRLIKSRKQQYRPESLPQLFDCWRKQSIIRKLKALATWAFFLYTFSPVYLPLIDTIMDYELGYVDYVESLFEVRYDDNMYSFYTFLNAVETYFTNVAVSGAIMNLLKEISVKDLSGYLKKTPIASELIRTSGDTFMLNPSIAFSHTCNVFDDVRKLHTAKMIIAPICSLITTMCIYGFVDTVLTYSYMSSNGNMSEEEILEAIFTSPAVIFGVISLIIPLIIHIALSKKSSAKMVQARMMLCASPTSYTAPSSTAAAAPAPTYTAPVSRPQVYDDGDVNAAFGGSKSSD